MIYFMVNKQPQQTEITTIALIHRLSFQGRTASLIGNHYKFNLQNFKALIIPRYHLNSYPILSPYYSNFSIRNIGNVYVIYLCFPLDYVIYGEITGTSKQNTTGKSTEFKTNTTITTSSKSSQDLIIVKLSIICSAGFRGS